MMHRPIILAVFPAVMLGLAAAERIATFMLGQFPSSPSLWRAWIWLHSSFGDLWLLIGSVVGSFSMQLLIVAVAGYGILRAVTARKWASLSFLANHSALIALGLPTLVAGRANLSSLEGDGFDIQQWGFVSAQLLEPLQWLFIAAGLVSCAFCHWVFFNEARRRSEPVIVRIRELQQNI